MKRYPHYWWALKSTRYPSEIAFLETSLSSGAVASPDGSDNCRVSEWCLLVASYRDGVSAGINVIHGESATVLYSRLATLCNSKSKTWLFVSPALPTLDAIGFKIKLQNREILLAGKDWMNPRTGNVKGEDKRDGLCILADPPTMILAKFPDLPGKLLILDIRNIGIEIITDERSLRVRCERYSEGMGKCVQALRQSGQGILRGTAGSQAVSALRTKYPVTSLHCHTNNRATACERDSLYGGRCEAYRIGDVDGPIHHLDIRNMYPAICRTLQLPCSIRRIYERERDATDSTLSNPSDKIAVATVRTKEPCYPLRRAGLVTYPCGEYRTVLAGPELQAARTADHIKRVHYAIEYSIAPFLSDYYSTWLQQLTKARENNDTMLQQWIKKVMVSLVGKFAETGKRWVAAKSRTERGPYDEWTEFGSDGLPIRCRNFGWYTQREEKYGESYWSMPSVASWITSAGRRLLWDHISIAGRENVWYTDTDSLFVTSEGLRRLHAVNLVRRGEAGYLRLIGSYTRVAIKGMRHYVADGKVICSGVEIGQIREGESRRDYAERIKRESASLVGGGADRVTSYRHTPKDEVYRHGTVMPDGTVIPFEVYDDK